MKNRSNMKIIVFESIILILVPIILLYLKRGYRILYFEVNPKIEKQKWFQRNLQKNRLELIWTFDPELLLLSHETAFEQIEKIYEKRFKNSRMIRKIENLLKSNLVNMIYKKALVEKLQKVINVQVLLNDLVNKNNYKSIIFFPTNLFEISPKIENKLDARIKISFLSNIVFYLQHIIGKIKYMAIIILGPIWLILHINKVVSNEEDKKKYQVGLRIYRTDLGFNYRHRSIDFLLDDKKINKTNTLFCIETDISAEYMKKLKGKRYNIVEMGKILNEVDKNFLKNTLNFRYLYFCFITAVLSCLEPLFLAETTPMILYKHLVWTRFLEKYHIKHYVVYNDFGISHIVRNILLNQNGVHTWYYEHTCSFPSIFSPPDSNLSMRHVIFSFLYYDNLVTWGKKPMRSYKSHPSLIKQYRNLGILWSEHTKTISEGKVHSNILKEIRKKMIKMPNKIISVFDDTFGKGIQPSNDLVLFIEGILKLLDDYPEIGVIFKEKNPFDEVENNSPEAVPIYLKIRAHERCYAAGRSDPADAIAVSDLVISICFTSCTIEALGASKKGLYFDPTNKFRDYYYDKFPQLVAHGYEELKELVQYWLYEITNEDFDKYLETYVKGELDAYVDGKAITRFRELLAY